MLRQSCRSLCCSRQLGRPLSLATASSSSSSASRVSSASSSSGSSGPSSSQSFLDRPPVTIDPKLVQDKTFVPQWPSFPPALPRKADVLDKALHPPSAEPPNPVVPPLSLAASPASMTRPQVLTPGPNVPLLPPSATPDAPTPLAVPEPELEAEQAAVLEQVRRGGSCFFTGAAGTGKSVLLRAIVEALHLDGKVVAVTATTGIAARNLGDQARTIHSWSYVGYASSAIHRAQNILEAEDTPKDHARYQALRRWIDTETLIIDEISMLDGRTLDMLDVMGRIIRGHSNPDNLIKPFGGLQLVFAGDFYQLPPVPDDNSDAQFAFESAAWKSLIHPSGPDMNCFFLRTVHRQGDPRFRNLLNRLRIGKSTSEDIALLQECKRPVKYEDGIEAIRLYSRRQAATDCNARYLKSLEGELRTYGAFDELQQGVLNAIKRGQASWRDVDKLKAYANTNSQMMPELEVKIGATVMMLKNQLLDGDYIVNGMQGIVTHCAEDSVTVRFASGLVKAIPRCRETIRLPDTHLSMSRRQFPLKVAHAITIHKSQGQTLERVVVNARHCWEAGQIYVALSRATSLEGLEIEFINRKNPGLRANERVLRFMSNFAADDARAIV